jgi:Trk K+ transport system NAD-binding subunit
MHVVIIGAGEVGTSIAAGLDDDHESDRRKICIDSG